jgi:ketosteroid isomerase-like protein
MSTRTNEDHRVAVTTIIPQTGAGSSDEELEVGRRFLAALASRDYDGLEACFQDHVNFRALVPSGLREGIGPQVTVAWLRRWFEDADLFDMQKMNVDVVVDRLHITYRIRLRKEGLTQIIEQQAYCSVNDGHITDMKLLCSGFRPEITA